MPPLNNREIWRGSTLCKLLLYATSTIPYSFEAGHKGVEVISSACLKPSWAKDGKTFICRHNCKKRISVFRNAEQSSVEQVRIEERERGPRSPRLNRGLHRHPHRLFWESDSVTAWAGVCRERDGNRWEKHKPQNSWKNIKVNYRELRQGTVSTLYILWVTLKGHLSVHLDHRQKYVKVWN